MALQTKVRSATADSMFVVDLILEGYGGAAAQEVEDDAAKSRSVQGYGPGSGVGA